MAKAKKEVAQVETQEQKSVSVLLLSEDQMVALTTSLLERPAKEVHELLIELQRQLSAQKEIIKVIKDADVSFTDEKAEA